MNLHDSRQLPLRRGEQRISDNNKPLSSTFYYGFDHDFAMSANNLSTKSAQSAPAWLARVAIAIFDIACIFGK